MLVEAFGDPKRIDSILHRKDQRRVKHCMVETLLDMDR
jgi:hypothetical protein